MTTTTYPYAYTTFTNASPPPFTTPTAIPSMFPFGPIPSFACSAPSGAPSSTPDAPLEHAESDSGSCAISNVESVNSHAFWDMYDCCKGGTITALGSSLPCTAVCYTKDDQSFLELGECLSKRVKVVVCSPPKAQRGEAKSHSSSASAESSSSKAASKTAEVSGVTGTNKPTSTSTSTSTSTPTQAASNASKLAGQNAVSKAGMVVFGVLAVTSVMGMLV